MKRETKRTHFIQFLKHHLLRFLSFSRQRGEENCCAFYFLLAQKTTPSREMNDLCSFEQPKFFCCSNSEEQSQSLTILRTPTLTNICIPLSIIIRLISRLLIGFQPSICICYWRQIIRRTFTHSQNSLYFLNKKNPFFVCCSTIKRSIEKDQSHLRSHGTVCEFLFSGEAMIWL